jgi:hypothetical protein
LGAAPLKRNANGVDDNAIVQDQSTDLDASVINEDPVNRLSSRGRGHAATF